MVGLRIRKYPDPSLRKKARDVRDLGEEEKTLLAYMVETMYANQGIGLAAPQVGVAKRIIVLDAGEGLLRMANPEITQKSGRASCEEGCLSVPGRLVEIERAQKISVTFLDENGNRAEKNCGGLAAKAIQHEIDHLNGRLIIDYLPWYQRVFPKRGEAKCLQ
jgi:peptide deformylase